MSDYEVLTSAADPVTPSIDDVRDAVDWHLAAHWQDDDLRWLLSSIRNVVTLAAVVGPEGQAQILRCFVELEQPARLHPGRGCVVRSHCKWGHAYTPGNILANGASRYRCRTCHNGRQKHGPLNISDEDRFFLYVDAPDALGCWRWTGGLSTGYGQFTFDDRNVKAHRWSYEFFRGDVPGGLVLDHLCRNRACVNPEHLEPVTHRVNVLRGAVCIPQLRDAGRARVDVVAWLAVLALVAAMALGGALTGSAW